MTSKASSRSKAKIPSAWAKKLRKAFRAAAPTALRAKIEAELHRLEAYAIEHLQKHGLEVKQQRSRVPLKYGALAAAISVSDFDENLPAGQISTWASTHLIFRELPGPLNKKQRGCKLTYEFKEMYAIANRLLFASDTSQEDKLAASVALQLPRLWLNLHLLHEESLRFVHELVDVVASLPRPDAATRLIAEARKQAASLAGKKKRGIRKPLTEAVDKVCLAMDEPSLESVLEQLMHDEADFDYGVRVEEVGNRVYYETRHGEKGSVSLGRLGNLIRECRAKRGTR
ncbi:MAG: hypothetical protein OES46_16140 [Gammaproteobacteria bacterium]|nr:hypothetical protein [Gammaproteobacteria bacterium]